MFKKCVWLWVLLILISTPVLSDDQFVYREISGKVLTLGDSVNINLKFNTYNISLINLIEEHFPKNWNLINSSSTSNLGNVIKWSEFSDENIISYNYEVMPSSVGEYFIKGFYWVDGINQPLEIRGDNKLIVENIIENDKSDNDIKPKENKKSEIEFKKSDPLELDEVETNLISSTSSNLILKDKEWARVFLTSTNTFYKIRIDKIFQDHIVFRFSDKINKIYQDTSKKIDINKDKILDLEIIFIKKVDEKTVLISLKEIEERKDSKVNAISGFAISNSNKKIEFSESQNKIIKNVYYLFMTLIAFGLLVFLVRFRSSNISSKVSEINPNHIAYLDQYFSIVKEKGIDISLAKNKLTQIGFNTEHVDIYISNKLKN